MQPMGRERIKFPSKVDHHIHGYNNWWEDEHQPSKKRERQKVKREISKELNRLLNI